MKIVVCPDSFKGSLSATEVTRTISDLLLEKFPNAEISEIPLADGGEGTGKIISGSGYPKELSIKVHDPLGRMISAKLYTDLTGKKAFIESAQIIGLPLLTIEERNPLLTTTKGLGEMIIKAIDIGCEEITVSLGGSATCDGGKGMIEVLSHYKPIKAHFKVICDVTNPLLGINGAVRVFAPQKGASNEELPILEQRLKDLVELALEEGWSKADDLYREGAGAAGGLGFAFQTYLNAETIRGIDFILEITDFENKIKGADLIITGEGKIDRQSLMGKVINGVLKYAEKRNIPIIAIGGFVEDEEELKAAGIKETYTISDSSLTLDENMEPDITKKNLTNCIEIMSKSIIFKQITT